MTATETRPNVYLRQLTRDLGEMPLDAEVATQARASLKPIELGVWFALNHHLWLYGVLPTGVKRLAAVGKVGPKTFETMMPALWLLFDHDQDGRWRDLELEEERNRRLQLEPGACLAFETIGGAGIPDVDPELSRTRSRSGKGGADKRWAEHRARKAEENRRKLELLQGGKADALSSDGKPIANPPSSDGKTDGKPTLNLPSGLLSGLPSGASFEPRADGLTDCSDLIDRSSVSQSVPRDAGAGDGREPNGKPASVSDSKPDGKPMPVPDSKPDGKPMPVPDGKPDGKPAPVPDGKPGLPPDGKGPSLDEIGTVVRRAVAKGGGHLDSGWQSPKCLETLRAAFAEGCDLERHYEPSLQAFTARATDKRIRYPANDPIMRAAWDLRRRDLPGKVPDQRPDLSRMAPTDRSMHQALERSLGPDSYASWCGSLAVAGIAGEVATLAVGSKFIRHHLEKTFERQLLAAAQMVWPQVKRVVLDLVRRA